MSDLDIRELDDGALEAFVEEHVKRLYGLPLAEFVAARNALSKALRPRDRAAADRVKALGKPSVSAWVVNQLHHREPGRLAALAELGERLRAQQAEGATAEQRRALMDERRSALDDALAVASALLEAAGHGAAPAILRRVATTLEALLAYGRAAPHPPPGRLVEDIAAPGFAVAAASVIGPARPAAPDSAPASASRAGAAHDETPPARGLTTVDDQPARIDPEARERARAQVQAARAAADTARRAARKADAALSEAAARAREAGEALVEAERALARARARAERAEVSEAEARNRAEASRAAAAQAAASLTEAERDLADLERGR